MTVYTLLLVDSGAEIIAFILSIIFFKKLSFFLKIVAFQVSIATSMDVLGFYLKEFYVSNVPVYNIYLLFDCAILLYAVYYHLKPKINSMLVLSVFGIYVLTWCFFMLKNGIHLFSIETYIFDSLILLVFYMTLFYYTMINYKGSLLQLPEFWVCLGIILFYGCNIPYFSMVPYLRKNCTKEENRMIFNLIRVLVSLRYLLIATSFLLFYRQNRNQQTQHIS